jgi:hypothetical protein
MHAAFELVAGTNVGRFRRADLCLQACVGAALGWLLAPWRLRMGWSRAPWACLGVAVWLAAYFHFGWNDTTQREVYYSDCGLTGMAILFAASTMPRRPAQAMLLAGGALVGAVVLGKQTGVIYLSLGLLSVALSGASSVGSPWRRTALAAAGSVVGLGALVVAVAIWGDLGRFVFWYFRYSFQVYRFFHTWDVVDLFADLDPRYSNLGALSLVAGIGAIALGLLPLRSIGFVLAPPALFVGALLQAKGWKYHFMPCFFGAHALLLLVTSAVFGERAGASPGQNAPPAPADSVQRAFTSAWFAWAMLCLVGWQCLDLLQHCEWMKARDLSVFPAPTAQAKETAELIRATTRPDDRLFYYGDEMDLLMLSERRPANPFYVSFFLNYRWALDDPKTTPRARLAIGQLQEVVRSDMCERLLRFKPAALVFQDNAHAGGDGYNATLEMCPPARLLIESEYALRATIGHNRIFLHRTRAEQ